MTKLRSSLFPMAIIVSMGFFSATTPVFAQRGGGSRGGGGFHGGGGGGSHSGGGSFGGGSVRGGGSSPSMGGNFSRGVAGSVARPSGGSYSTGGPFAAGGASQRPGDYSRAVNSGYGNARGEAPSTAASGYVRPDGQWHSFSVNRSAGASSGTRSFSGQGNEIWENAPAGRSAATANPAAASVRNSSASAGNTFSRSASLQSPSSAAALSARSSIGSGIVSSVPRNYNGFGGFRTNGGFGGYPYRGFRGGCWNCGFGLGFGWPLFGWGLYPYSYWPYSYWDDPWLSGGTGYGYYSDPSGYNVYNDNYNSSNDGGSYNSPQGYSSGPADNNPGPDQNVSGEQVTEQTQPYASNAPVVQLYLKDGTVYSVQDYWLADGKLHFTVDNGVEFSFDLNQLDMQRTVDENARRGVQLVLKPAPSNQSNP